MCVVCTEMAKGKLNRSEARRALDEMALDPAQEEHVRQVTEELNKSEPKPKKILPPSVKFTKHP